MTPQKLLRHLKNESDCTHTAIFIYLKTLHSFSQGHAGQNPGVNSKKKPDSDEKEKEEAEREEEEEEVAAKKKLDSDEEEKEEEEREAEEEVVAAKKKQDSDEEGKEKEERDQEEGEVAAALDSNDVSCEQVDAYACDHAKPGKETQITSDNHTDSVSEGIDSCESAKNEPNGKDKDETDVTGQKKVMGGGVQVDNQFSHNNIDENANDQSKYQPDPKIGTEIPKGPESECKDGGDTSINVPGDNVLTDVVSPPEGASEEKSDESPVHGGQDDLILSAKLIRIAPETSSF